MMNPCWIITTGRLAMCPVGPADLADLQALKADPLVFAILLGGVRTPEQAARELAEEMQFWAAHGVGIWSVRDARTQQFLGITGFMKRPDGRGIALRFAFRMAIHGHGYASEAAGAALRFAHTRAGLARVVAVARDSNIASRTVLGGIGMVECDRFTQQGHAMVMYESVA